MASIEVRDVTVTRDQRAALDGVSLSVDDGETLAIVGPVGAGKSLLLQVVVGLVEPTSGEVLVGGEDVTTTRPRRRDVSMMFQDYALHPHRDVYDNLTFAATLRRDHDKEQLASQVDDIIDYLGIGESLDARPADLDEHRKQRVAAGRALVREANAYLLDEPFSAQPDRLRPHVRSVILQWQRERGRTTILTTSDVDEALSTADRVAVMHQGFVHQVGTPRELYERPADMFVAGYLGAPPMNLIPGFPVDRGVETPVGVLPLGEAHSAWVEGRDVVVVGVRPEHLVEVDVAGNGLGFLFQAAVDEVEWRGRNQYAYLGYEIDPAIEEVLAEVEELVDFDLFQTFVLAELPSQRRLSSGATMVLGARPEHVHLFDPVTGENLTRR